MYQDEYAEMIQQPDYQKPTVHYIQNSQPIQVGCSAHVKTVDHPAEYLNRAPYVITSCVISSDETTGEFETVNTKYVPYKKA